MSQDLSAIFARAKSDGNGGFVLSPEDAELVKAQALANSNGQMPQMPTASEKSQQDEYNEKVTPEMNDHIQQCIFNDSVKELNSKIDSLLSKYTSPHADILSPYKRKGNNMRLLFSDDTALATYTTSIKEGAVEYVDIYEEREELIKTKKELELYKCRLDYVDGLMNSTEEAKEIIRKNALNEMTFGTDSESFNKLLNAFTENIDKAIVAVDEFINENKDKVIMLSDVRNSCLRSIDKMISNLDTHAPNHSYRLSQLNTTKKAYEDIENLTLIGDILDEYIANNTTALNRRMRLMNQEFQADKKSTALNDISKMLSDGNPSHIIKLLYEMSISEFSDKDVIGAVYLMLNTLAKLADVGQAHINIPARLIIIALDSVTNGTYDLTGGEELFLSKVFEVCVEKFVAAYRKNPHTMNYDEISKYFHERYLS